MAHSGDRGKKGDKRVHFEFSAPAKNDASDIKIKNFMKEVDINQIQDWINEISDNTNKFNRLNKIDQLEKFLTEVKLSLAIGSMDSDSTKMIKEFLSNNHIENVAGLKKTINDLLTEDANVKKTGFKKT